MSATVRVTQLLAFAAQCLAYAANDGQKMFAVVSVAATAATDTTAIGSTVPQLVWMPPAVAVVFAAGATSGLRRIGRGATSGLLAARPWQVASAEVASSMAVLGSSGLGLPVSMTQSIAGGLVGTAIAEGRHRVRWQFTMPMITAWVVTLPAGLVAGLATGFALERILVWKGIG